MAIGSSKLNEHKVRQIKELFEITNLSDSQIASMFDVSREHINLIRNGKRWNTDKKSFISKVELELDGIKLVDTKLPSPPNQN